MHSLSIVITLDMHTVNSPSAARPAPGGRRPQVPCNGPLSGAAIGCHAAPPSSGQWPQQRLRRASTGDPCPETWPVAGFNFPVQGRALLAGEQNTRRLLQGAS